MFFLFDKPIPFFLIYINKKKKERLKNFNEINFKLIKKYLLFFDFIIILYNIVTLPYFINNLFSLKALYI